MKKIIFIISVLFLCGCRNEKNFTCISKIINDEQGYELIATYKIYYEDTFVTKIEEEEIYISENKETLNYFYEYKNLNYKNLNDSYGGIIYTLEKEKNRVKLNSVLDFSIINVENMLKNKYLYKDYVVSNKLTTVGAKYIYESKGAVCE